RPAHPAVRHRRALERLERRHLAQHVGGALPAHVRGRQPQVPRLAAPAARDREAPGEARVTRHRRDVRHPGLRVLVHRAREALQTLLELRELHRLRVPPPAAPATACRSPRCRASAEAAGSRGPAPARPTRRFSSAHPAGGRPGRAPSGRGVRVVPFACAPAGDDMQLGRLAQIRRYPVKSMEGEGLDAARIGPRGIPGARAWAGRDERRGGTRGAKQIAALMRLRARYPEPPADHGSSPAEIALPDGSTVGTGDPDVAARLTAALEHPVTLWPLLPAEAVEHYRRGPRDHADLEQELRAVFARTP